MKKKLAVGALTATAAAALTGALISPSIATASTTATTTTADRTDAAHHTAKPTVVLVHGAWADAAGWTAVAQRLQHAGYPVVAPPNPLRGLDADAAYISSFLNRISGPVVLVGHSYGGAVITNAAVGHSNVKALVYIAAFAPDKGDSLQSLNGSALGKKIPAVPLQPASYPEAGGNQGTELTIEYSKYSNVFLDNELPRSQANALAIEQRPLSLDSVTETSGTPAWKTIPSWYLVSKNDRAISPDLERFMAKRAGAHTVQVSAPHLVMVTDPAPVTKLIETAAATTR